MNIVEIIFVDYGAQGEYGLLGKEVAKSNVRDMSASEREAEVAELKTWLGAHVIAIEVEEVSAV